MKIGIDARQASHRKHHGLRTYVVNLVHSLSRIDGQNEYMVYLDRKDPHPFNDLPSNFHLRVLPWRFRYVSTLLNDYLLLPRQIVRDKIEIMHYPANPVNLGFLPKTIVTVHDVIPFFGRRQSLLKKNFREFVYFWYFSTLIQQASKRASLLLTVSERSRADLLDCLKVPPSKIRAIPSGVSGVFRRIKRVEEIVAIKKTYALGDRFILGFAHKNGGRIARAYLRLPDLLKSQFRVGLICQTQYLPKEITRVAGDDKLWENIVPIPPVSEEELVLLYNAASLFVFPSFYEGFGLPVLEAMKCGCPVLCSARGALVEVAGEGALFIASESLDHPSQFEQETAEKMERILTDTSLRNNLIRKGLSWAEKWNWQRTALDTLKVYEDLHQKEDH